MQELIVQEIFQIAARTNVPSDVLVMALAEVLAATAATIDLHVPANRRTSIDDRLDSFIAHVRRRHPEILMAILKNRILKKD